MPATEPEPTRPSLNAEIHTGPVTGGEVVGIKVGTLVSVYLFGDAPVPFSSAVPGTRTEPYKFLDSYTFDDQAVFFGRERLTGQLSANLMAHPTTALIGRPAIGKTSLIHAGLVPALGRQAHLAAFSVRDYAAPLEGVRAALAEIPNANLAKVNGATLAALANAFTGATGRQLVIFFDQFERLFALPGAQQEEFAREVTEAQANDRQNQLHLVFVLRPKFRAAVADLQLRFPDAALLSNVQEIGGLDAEGAKQAITAPLHSNGGLDLAFVEPELIEKWLLPQLVELGGPAIEPAPLQIVLTRLYARAQAAVAGTGRQPELTVELYKGLGQARGILRSYLSDERSGLAASDTEWMTVRRLLNVLAQGDSLQFYGLPELARGAGTTEAGANAWLEKMAQHRLVEGRPDGAYALIANYMVGEIRKWFPDELDEQSARQALTRAVADWDDQGVLIERRRLQRLQRALALLRPEPRELALLMRSAAAYEANPGFWLEAIHKDEATCRTLQRLEAGEDADPAVGEVRQALGLRERGEFKSLGQAAVCSPIGDVRISAALALSALGVPAVLAALGPYLDSRSLRERLAAITALAWIRFRGVHWEWPALAVAPLVLLVVIYLRLWSNRIKIAAVTASATAGTVLVGYAAALTPVVAARISGNFLGNPFSEYVLAVAVEAIVGGMGGLAYAIANAIAPPSRSRLTAVLRVLTILAGFAFANAFVLGASTGFFPDPRALLVGALVASGFAAGNELGLYLQSRGSLFRIGSSSIGLALSAGLAAGFAQWVTASLHLLETERDFVLWQFAGGVSVFVFPLTATGAAAHIVTNAIQGGVIGLGLATGLWIGEQLAIQLEWARYV